MIESGMAFPLIGSAFFHVGLWHLVGNMLFLWVFGNALNSKVGNLIYPIFFFIVAAMSDVIHLAADFYRHLLGGKALHGGDPELNDWLARAAQYGPDPLSAAACLDRCLEAAEQIDRNVNQATCLESWLDDLARRQALATGG